MSSLRGAEISGERKRVILTEQRLTVKEERETQSQEMETQHWGWL